MSGWKDNEKEKESEEAKLHDKSIQAEPLESEDSRGSRTGIPGCPNTFGLASTTFTVLQRPQTHEHIDASINMHVRAQL